MCCCGKPTINGELGYKWQPNDSPTVRPVHPPMNGQDGETILWDEPGRCGGLDLHSHHFLVTKWYSTYYLLVGHGGGDQRIKLFSLLPASLSAMDSNTRYSLLYAIYKAHSDGADEATMTERIRWNTAAAQKRIKTRKQRGSNGVKVWIEPVTTA